MPNKSMYSLAQKAEIILKKLSGTSVEDLAKEYGCSVPSIYVWERELRAHVRDKEKAPPPETEYEVLVEKNGEQIIRMKNKNGSPLNILKSERKLFSYISSDETVAIFKFKKENFFKLLEGEQNESKAKDESSNQ